MRSWSPTPLLASIVAATTWTVTAGIEHQAYAQTAAPQGKSSPRLADAAKLKNPVKPVAMSISKGKTLYDTHCASCHGTGGKGDGKMAAMMKPTKPSDLTDASRKHGTTDGEIFTVIHEGSKGTAMRGYAARMQTEDIWNVVNYVKTLAQNRPKSR
jgi:mono/diheme cytochrome c family protein